MAGIGDNWGTREELLHPRGPDGKWIRKGGIPKAAIERVLGFLSNFRPRTFQSDAQATQYVQNLGHKNPARFGGGKLLSRLSLDLDATNDDLRDGVVDNPSTQKFIDMMDRSAIEAPDDMILSRVVGVDSFGFTPQTVNGTNSDTDPGLRGMAGKLIADRGYATAGVGTPLSNRPPGTVLMVNAVPKGTKIMVPGTGNDRTIFMDKGQTMRVTKVQPDGAGGWTVYTAVTNEKSDREIPAPIGGPVGAGRPVDREARIKAGERSQQKQMRAEGDLLVQEREAGRQTEAERERAALEAEQQDRMRRRGPERPVQPQQPAPPGTPPPRNEPILARSVGGGAPGGGAPAAPAAPAPGTAPEAPAPVPRRAVDLRLAVRDANIQAPAAGNNRKQFNEAYLGIITGKKEPIDAVRELDRDTVDLEAQGDPDADNLRQLSDLIKKEYGLDVPAPPRKVGPTTAEAGLPKVVKKAPPKIFKEPEPGATPAKAADVPRTAQGLPKQEMDDLNTTIPKLKEIARKEGITVPSKGRKAAIQEAIRDARKGTAPGPNNLPPVSSLPPRARALPPVKKATPAPAAPAAAPPTGAPDLDRMLKAELIAEAGRRGVTVRQSWTKDRIKAAILGETPTPAAPTPAKMGGRSTGGTFIGNLPAEGAGPDLDRMLKADLLREAKERGVDVRPSWTKDRIKAAIRGESAPPAAKAAKAAAPAVNPDDPEERVKALFNNRRPTMPNLREFAREQGIQIGKDDSRGEIILAILGRAEPRRGLGTVPAKKAVPRPSVPGAVMGQRSNAPEIPNRWGAMGTGGEVEFHADGVIGQRLQGMGDDRLMDVDGEPLSNIVGRMATRAVRGDITQAQLLDELRRLEVRLPEGSKARRGVAGMVREIDAPERTVDIPDGTPEPLRRLMEKLLQIPIARAEVDRPGFHRSREDSEVDRLQGIIEEVNSGRLRPLRLETELRNLQNRMHESQEGKFEVDRAIGEAIRESKEARTGSAPNLPTPGTPEAIKAERLVPDGSVAGPRAQVPVENAPRKRSLREAWVRAEINAPGGSPKRQLDEIKTDLFEGKLTPEEAVRRLETEIAFNKDGRTEIEAELRNPDLTPAERRQFQSALANADGGIAAQEKASKFLRLYFKDEKPGIEEIKVTAPPEVKEFIKDAAPEDIDKLAEVGDLDKPKGSTVDEKMENLVQQVAVQEVARRQAKKAPAKVAKAVAPAPPTVPKDPTKVDTNLVADDLNVPEDIKKDVQRQLDEGKLTPAAIGRDLEETAKAMKSMAVLTHGDWNIESRDKDTPEFQRDRLEKLAVRDRMFAEADAVQALADRMKTMRRPTKRTAPSTPEAKSLQGKVDDLQARIIDNALLDLKGARTREEGDNALAGLTMPDLRRLADQSGIPRQRTKAALKDSILDRFTPDDPTSAARRAKTADLTRMDDDELADLFSSVTRASTLDPDAMAKIDAEFDRREVVDVPEILTPEQREIDDLVANGASYQEAYAEVHGMDPEKLVQEELESNLDLQKAPGETREKALRRLYRERTYVTYLRAEMWTNGNLLNNAARQRNARAELGGKVTPITAMELFSGRRDVARKYASEELKRFWEEVEPRRTYIEFRAEALGRIADKRAAQKAKGQGQERDFGL